MRCFVTVGSCCTLLSTVMLEGAVSASRARVTGGGRLASLFWRLGVALLLTVLLLGALAARADAKPRIKVHCEVYATNYVDPIALSDHLHHQIGNTSTTNRSTGESLSSNRRTSCNEGWFTSAGWFPVERNESVKGVNVYYRAPGDQRTIKAIPKGLQLLSTEQKYTCNDGPFQATPPYGCRARWATSVSFPDCINTSRLTNEATNAVESRNGACPGTHPYRIPKISYLIMHSEGGVTNPLQISTGTNAWASYTSMHADYFAANQEVFNNTLLDLCLRDVLDRVTVADSRCGR